TARAVRVPTVRTALTWPSRTVRMPFSSVETDRTPPRERQSWQGGIMARRTRRLAGVLLAAALASAVAATGTDAAPRATHRADVGLTADTMNIDYVYGDTSGLQKAGLVAFTGDGGEQFKTFADIANKNGGAGGRQINVTLHQYTVPSTATSERPA